MTLVALDARVRPGWVDEAGRMTAHAFADAFAEANDAALEALGLGPGYGAATGFSLAVTEAKYAYRRALSENESYRILSWPAGVDGRRLSLAHRMVRPDGRVVAEAEILFLHVDASDRRAASFSPETRARLSEEAALAHLRSPAA